MISIRGFFFDVLRLAIAGGMVGFRAHRNRLIVALQSSAHHCGSCCGARILLPSVQKCSTSTFFLRFGSCRVLKSPVRRASASALRHARRPVVEAMPSFPVPRLQDPLKPKGERRLYACFGFSCGYARFTFLHDNGSAGLFWGQNSSADNEDGEPSRPCSGGRRGTRSARSAAS